MAGKKGRSGGARLGSGPKHVPEDAVDAPRLIATFESCEAYVTWSAAELDAGRASQARHDGRNKSADTMKKIISAKAGLAELEQLRALVKRSEAAANRRAANEIEDRYGQGADAPPFGRVPLPPGAKT